jgi:hypothetical protein
MAIKENDPEILIPSIFDYLSRPNKGTARIDGVKVELLDAEVLNLKAFRRAAEIAPEAQPTATTTASNGSIISWQNQIWHDLQITKDGLLPAFAKAFGQFNQGLMLVTINTVSIFPRISYRILENLKEALTKMKIDGRR